MPDPLVVVRSLAVRPVLASLVALSIVAGLGGQTPAPGRAVGIFEAHGDIGSPAIEGRTFYNAATEAYTLRAGGLNMWEERDEFQFAWRRISGDFILQAQVAFHGEGVDPHRKAGVIVRQSLEDNSPYVDGALHGV